MNRFESFMGVCHCLPKRMPWLNLGRTLLAGNGVGSHTRQAVSAVLDCPCCFRQAVAHSLRWCRPATRVATNSDNERILVPYDEARGAIADGDLLLFRGRGPIATAGRGVHGHAAKAAWWDDDLFCLEFRAFRGGRAVLLSHLVERWPGRIDVFETNPEGRWPNYDRAEATRTMRRLTGLEYGWVNVLFVALAHAPVVRWFRTAPADDSTASERPPFCSQAVVMAERVGGGVDPVPWLADRHTEPADLARSPFYRYRFTLVP